MTKLGAVLGAVLGFAATAALAPLAAAAPGDLDDPLGRPSGGTRGYVRAPHSAFVPTEHADISKILYINRCATGCTFTKSSQSDALTNQTIIGGVPPGTMMTLSPFGFSDQIFDEVVQCVREVYAPFDVQVVIVDPGQVPHHEAVLAGHSSEMSLGPGILGIAPLDTNTCSAMNNVISFSFANDHGADPLGMCWTLSQESAHAYGLDHEFECTDPMTYIGDNCGQKFFRNKLVQCGRNAPEPCICGGTLQNSHVKLLGVFGPGTTVIDPPVMNITMPANNATVAPGFSVFATATDHRGVSRMELYVNGWKWTDVAGVPLKTSPYILSLPTRVPDGVMDIKVRACNDLDKCAEQSITVTRGAPCTSATACLTGQTCDAGKCAWAAPTGATGDACTFNEFCTSDLCQPLSGGDSICTSPCFGGPNDQCDMGFKCSGKTGQAGVCVPDTSSTGCCSAADPSTGVIAINLGLGGVVGLVIIRRRRRRA